MRAPVYLVRAGARLALELLQDGLAYSAPVFRRGLVRRALGLLDVGPEMLDGRLALELVPDTAKVFQEEIVLRIAQGETRGAKAAWSLLARLLDVDRPFAESILIANWPEDPKIALSVIDVRYGTWPSNLVEKIKEAQALAGPTVSRHFIAAAESYVMPTEDETNSVEHFSVLPKGIIKSLLFGRRNYLIRDNSNMQICRVSFVGLSQSGYFMARIGPVTRLWRCSCVVRRERP
jgi:hypothetical protein